MLTRRIAAGPRAAFLKAQRPELLRERNLATWLVKSDTEFAELVVGVKRASCLLRSIASGSGSSCCTCGLLVQI
jgi:hypothetical protein